MSSADLITPYVTLFSTQSLVSQVSLKFYVIIKKYKNRLVKIQRQHLNSIETQVILGKLEGSRIKKDLPHTHQTRDNGGYACEVDRLTCKNYASVF